MDAYGTWKELRKLIPEEKRVRGLTVFLTNLIDSGWDQQGYIYCDWPVTRWKELPAVCKKLDLLPEEDYLE